MVDRVQHTLWLLRGRPVIQVDQRMIVHLLVEHREIGADLFAATALEAIQMASNDKPMPAEAHQRLIKRRKKKRVSRAMTQPVTPAQY